MHSPTTGTPLPPNLGTRILPYSWELYISTSKWSSPGSAQTHNIASYNNTISELVRRDLSYLLDSPQLTRSFLQSVQGNKSRCFIIRGAAAAAAGHSGAQLAVLGEAAIGATVQIWWPLDENWYTGVVTGFDDLRFQHTIAYADGDVEFLKLWAPNQLVSPSLCCMHNNSIPCPLQGACFKFAWCSLWMMLWNW